jgi:hypothetical protein
MVAMLLFDSLQQNYFIKSAIIVVPISQLPLSAMLLILKSTLLEWPPVRLRM